ncbi:Glycerol-3-phosphate acyltransferase, chloroplastic-like protein [Drosera capensis]
MVDVRWLTSDGRQAVVDKRWLMAMVVGRWQTNGGWLVVVAWWLSVGWRSVVERCAGSRSSNGRQFWVFKFLSRGGSQIIWIAPSDGRDRPNPDMGEWHPAPFDVSVVDRMRKLTAHASVPGHIFPLAVLCYDIMPPPLQIEKEIGEKRVISFHGTGLSVGPEINYSDLAIGLMEDEATTSKSALTNAEDS